MNNKNQKYEVHLRSLIENSKENEIRLQKFQSIELGLLKANSFSAIYQVLTSSLRRLFNLNKVVLNLSDPTHELRRMCDDIDENSEHLGQLRLIDDPDRSSHFLEIRDGPVLRLYDKLADRWIFGDTWLPEISIALLPLVRDGKILGSLCLSCSDQRFCGENVNKTPLTRLSRLTSICLENNLNSVRLRDAGIIDPLTGAKNRQFHDQRLVEEVARTRRSGRSLAFLFIDLDGFHLINDRYGTTFGDLVLQTVAKEIAQNLRATDVLTRYAGAEFAVLQPDTDILEAESAANRILKIINNKIVSCGHGPRLTLSASIGIATMDSADYLMDGGLLTNAARGALLEAKRRGRNQVILSPQIMAGVGS